MTARQTMQLLTMHDVRTWLSDRGVVHALDVTNQGDEIIELPGRQPDGTYNRRAVLAWLGY